MELDIRGMMTDEGVLEMERFIDSAQLSGISTVIIIHGKGTERSGRPCSRRSRPTRR